MRLSHLFFLPELQDEKLMHLNARHTRTARDPLVNCFTLTFLQIFLFNVCHRFRILQNGFEGIE